MKRSLSVVLVLAMLLALVPAAGIAPVMAVAATMGDVDNNAQVDSTDARLILQYAVGKIGADALDVAAADVDGNDVLDSTDARLILQYAVGKITAFPNSGAYVPGTMSPNDEEAGTPFATLDEVKENAPAAVKSDTKQFGYFAFTTDMNAWLPFNVALHASGDHLTAMLPAGVDVKALIPTFTYYGASVKHGDVTVQSNVTALDFTEPVVLTLAAQDGSTRIVTVTVETLNTGLPSMAVTLKDYVGADTIEKEAYTKATFYLGGGDSSLCDYAQDDPILVAGKIKGRGNSSWLLDEKKSYTLKLDKKTALLDMAASKNWAIVANYEDKTLLRNIMANYFATAAGVPAVMQIRPVDMWIDGEYWGTYNLTEKIEIEPARVNITPVEKPDDEDFVDLAADKVGYLLEFDAHVAELNAGGLLENVQAVNPDTEWQRLGWSRWEYTYYDCARNTDTTDFVYYNPDTDETFFRVAFMGKWVTVKEPSTENLNHNPEMRAYIFRKVRELDAALEAGRHDVIYSMLDLESFAAWALVQEMMDNTDSTFHSSVYMYKDVDGKFTFGPAWDFDRSSGNCSYWTKDIGALIDSRWGRAAFRTTKGRAALESVWARFEENAADWNVAFETYQQLIAKSRAYNFERWDILKKHVLYNPENLTSEYLLSIYEGEEAQLYIDHLAGWLKGRYTQMCRKRASRFD